MNNSDLDFIKKNINAITDFRNAVENAASKYTSIAASKYWNLYCIENSLRQAGVSIKDAPNAEYLYEKIPESVILNSIEINNATPVCECVFELLGLDYDKLILE